MIELVLFTSVVSVVIISTTIALFVRSRSRHAKQLLMLKNTELNHQRELTRYNIRVTENERKRIASDLHDGVGSRIVTFRLSFDKLNIDEGVKKKLKAEADELLGAVREISHDLMPSALKHFGLNVALIQFIDRMNAGNEIEFTSKLNATITFDDEVNLEIYRVVQETAVNALKHSGADNVHICNEDQEQGVLFTITDNGSGLLSKSGIGLMSIEQRLNTIRSTPQWKNDANGTQIQFLVPSINLSE